jgi:DNA-binding SARP family transcriptional activator
MASEVASARLQLLSRFEVEVEGRPIELKPSSQRLLAFLALTDRPMGRAYTAFQLWPDKPDSRAMANLRSALWRLRQQPAELVETTPTHVRLSTSVWVDARDGLRDLATFIRLGGGETGALLTADLLPEWYDEWLVAERERLRQVRLHTLEMWCRELIAQSRAADALDLALRAIAVEPLRESSHRLVIEAHLAEGNVSEASRHVAAFHARLSEELGVVPSKALMSLVPDTNH